MSTFIHWNEQLFKEVKSIWQQVSLLWGIVQNDMIISDQQLMDSEENVERLILELRNWWKKVQAHINSSK